MSTEETYHGKEEEHMAYEEASSYNSQDLSKSYRTRGQRH